MSPKEKEIPLHEQINANIAPIKVMLDKQEVDAVRVMLNNKTVKGMEVGERRNFFGFELTMQPDGETCTGFIPYILAQSEIEAGRFKLISMSDRFDFKEETKDDRRAFHQTPLQTLRTVQKLDVEQLRKWVTSNFGFSVSDNATKEQLLNIIVDKIGGTQQDLDEAVNVKEIQPQLQDVTKKKSG